MSSRRSRGSRELTQEQKERFVAAAVELHRACCEPFLDYREEHYRTLSTLNQAICVALTAIHGRIPWYPSGPGVAALPPDILAERERNRQRQE
jgi:hypothetical protein